MGVSSRAWPLVAAIFAGVSSAYVMSYTNVYYNCLPLGAKPSLALLGMVGFALTYGVGIALATLLLGFLAVRYLREEPKGSIIMLALPLVMILAAAIFSALFLHGNGVPEHCAF